MAIKLIAMKEYYLLQARQISGRYLNPFQDY